MKIIDIDYEIFMSLIPAPIDEKNICSDALLDVIYDDCRYTEKGCISVGLVHNLPTMTVCGYTMMVYFTLPFKDEVRKNFVNIWKQGIVSRLTGVSLPTDKNTIYILDDECDLVYGLFFGKETIEVIIKFNQKE